MSVSYSTPLFARLFPRFFGSSAGGVRHPGSAIFPLVILILLAAGCASSTVPKPSDEDAAPYAGGAINVGDDIKVFFPGAPSLNFAQKVGVDGILNLGPSGNIKVEGKTEKEVEDELLGIFGPELNDKEVNITVESIGFPVFVGGAVLRPGKVMVTHSVTVLEAIMEAGGFDPNKANLRKVHIIRQINGVQKTFVLDLKGALHDAQTRPFHLRPSDIVVVPARFVYF